MCRSPNPHDETPIFRVINNWNNLDNKTVTSGSINIFKGNLERLGQSKDLFVGN